MEDERLTAVIRAARESDTPDVMELTRCIWEGEDYVPHVWSEWLSDTQGFLAVAECEGRVIGLGKLTRLSEEDWWLEGLRVHPEFEGRGVASQLHEYLLKTWKRIGKGTVRLGTASFRLQVHHLCDRLGFRKISEFTPFIAPVYTAPTEDIRSVSNFSSAPNCDSEPDRDLDFGRDSATDQLAPAATGNRALSSSTTPSFFTPLTKEELSEATSFARQSPSMAFSAGLMDLGWQWAPPRESYVARFVKEGRVWWWRGRRGLLAIGDSKEPQKEPTAMIVLLACSKEEVVDLLRDCRRLAASLGYRQARWMAPLHPDLLPALEAASFKRDWDESMFIYSRP